MLDRSTQEILVVVPTPPPNSRRWALDDGAPWLHKIYILFPIQEHAWLSLTLHSDANNCPVCSQRRARWQQWICGGWHVVKNWSPIWNQRHWYSGILRGITARCELWIDGLTLFVRCVAVELIMEWDIACMVGLVWYLLTRTWPHTSSYVQWATPETDLA